MDQLNTIPIENYLNRVRIASKSGQKNVNLSITEAVMLSDSLAVVMTRLSGKLDSLIAQASQQEAVIEVQMDGGGFK